MAVELRLREMPDHEVRRGAARWSGMVTLEEALRAREQFLSAKPQLRAYQEEIDRTLQNVIGFEKRMAVLGMMMQVKTHQLKDAVLYLNGRIKRSPSSS
ncbi:MAG: hypothetical protein AB9866_23220 [Syntrophobacteraceae bacterium]